jgi:WD40 repeat protein
MRLKIKLFMLGVFLAGCAKSQLNPAPTPATYKPIISTATALATSTAIPPTTTPTAALREIKVSSENGRTYLEGFVDQVNSLAWLGDGKTLIISSQQNYLVYFDTQSKKVTINPVSDMPISSIALSPDKKILAAISAGPFVDKISVHFIDLETNNVVQTIKFERTPVFIGNALSVREGAGIFAPDGKTFILNSGWEIMTWDIASGKQIQTIFQRDPPHSAVTGLFLTTNNLVFTNQNGQEYINFLGWNTDTWKLTKTFKFHWDNLGVVSPFSSAFSISPDGNNFAVISGEEVLEINVWDIDTFKKLLNITVSDIKPSYGFTGRKIVYDSSGKYIAAIGVYSNAGSNLNIYNAITGKLIHQLGLFAADALEFSPDGTKLAAGGGSVIIWDLSQP